MLNLGTWLKQLEARIAALPPESLLGSKEEIMPDERELGVVPEHLRGLYSLVAKDTEEVEGLERRIEEIELAHQEGHATTKDFDCGALLDEAEGLIEKRKKLEGDTADIKGLFGACMHAELKALGIEVDSPIGVRKGFTVVARDSGSSRMSGISGALAALILGGPVRKSA